MMFLISCSNDRCESIVCENGGECVDGVCVCPSDFLGNNCELVNFNQIQTLLSNYTPLELYQGGIPLDSLYGKEYNEGLIFYLDTLTGKGLVVAKEPLETEHAWGCEKEDIVDIENGAEAHEELGDGKRLTDAIIETCTFVLYVTAADACRELGPEWHLPSYLELAEIFRVLHLGRGYSMPFGLVSSSEYNGDDYVLFYPTDLTGLFPGSVPQLKVTLDKVLPVASF